MYEPFLNLISNIDFFRIGTYLGVVVTIMFIVMIIRKKNRDERGWKIFGKASIVSFIWLMVLINVIAKIIGPYGDLGDIGYIQYGSTTQWIYNSTIMVEIIAVFIIRKFE